MKDFIIFSVVLILPLIIGRVQRKEIPFMGKEFTTIIKGISILSVVWAHSCARLNIGGIQFIAGAGVALFLICSGYGLEMSYSKNGLNSFWKKRILRLCIPFWIVQIIGMILTKEFTINKLFSAMLFIRGNWFIRYIVVCYMIFYVCKKIVEYCNFNEGQEIAIFCLTFGVWFIIDSIFMADQGMPFLAARQMISFVFGVAVAKQRSLYEYIFSKKRMIIFGGGDRNPLHGTNAAQCYKGFAVFSF